MANSISIVTPVDSESFTCGYCGPPGGRSQAETFFKTADLIARQLSCQVYQKMVDRGWRRSGSYCYKPDLKISCCPQYTIKLDALEFKPSKSQRKQLNRWNRFVLEGDGKDDLYNDRGHKKPKGTKASTTEHYSLVSSLHSSEYNSVMDKDPAHKFEVTLEPSSYTAEKYALYERYQAVIHNDERNTPEGFKRFLVESPLIEDPIAYSTTPPKHLPMTYGSYHQLYRLDGVLIAIGVIDILPNCVSSVYFMYDSKWERFSLGKLSALREASLAAEIRAAGAAEMTSLYMGFYIHSCPKMRYKGDYSPSYLADPETYAWFRLETCKPLLDKYRYACFAYENHSLDTPAGRSEDIGSDERILNGALREIRVIDTVNNRQLKVIPLILSKHWRMTSSRRIFSAYAAGMGIELAKDVLLEL